MAKYSMKQDGKEVGPASVYAEPHTMDGKKLTAKDAGKPQSVNFADEIKMSVGRISKGQNTEVKTSGIKMRGTGAATKGVMSRGPMA
jgi:hypothetical protein